MNKLSAMQSIEFMLNVTGVIIIFSLGVMVYYLYLKWKDWKEDRESENND